MSPVEAKAIISALANGIDPETGEVLPRESVLNRPQVIRALFVAADALNLTVKSAERRRSLPSKAGRPWLPDEDQELLDQFNSGMNVKVIAAGHGRTQGAIAARLVRLGCISARDEVYPRPSRGAKR